MSLKKIKNSEGKKKSDELDPSKDEFIAKTTSLLDWAYERRRALGLLLVLALVIAVAGIFANRYIDNRAATESKLLASGLQVSMAPVVAPDQEAEDAPPRAPGEDETVTFDSVKARATEALQRWSEVVSKTDDLKGVAEIGKADAYMDLGEYEKAAGAYRTFLDAKSGAADFLRFQAVEGLAYALEGMGKVDEARTELEKLMSNSEGQIKKMATFQAARLAEKSGDQEAAKKHYKDVLSGYEGEDTRPSRFDIVFVQARNRLLTIDPDADVPDMPAGAGGTGLDGMDPRMLQQLLQAQRAGAS